MLIGDWLGRRARLSPSRTALIDETDGGRAISYRAWDVAANRTAHLLRERLGVSRGDRVAVLAHNCVPYLDLWFACGKLGAVLQTLNWRLTAHELAALVADATPAALVYGPAFAAQVAALREAGAPVGRYLALDEAARVSPDDLLLAERERLPDTPPPPVELSWDDPWVICYTGGTTGLPKGALLTHGNITWNAVNTVTSWGLCQDDVAILNAPLFHTGGLNVFTAPLVYAGGASVVCRGFDPEQVYDLLEGAGVTLFFGVPTMFVALQQHPRWATADFACLKLVISGGAPCPDPVREAFWARGVDFKLGYGLTEAGPNTFWLPSEELRRKPGAVGYPLMHIDARVMDAEGRPCAPGEVGELHVRGPHVCAGYWRRPEETARAIVGGWLHTGDLARSDEDGCYTIVGRLKDVIISGGENIYPAEIESVLASHPAVAEAAVVGVPDPKWGEVGLAVVAALPEAVLDADDLLGFCRERLARYKIPRAVVFTPSLPKTAAGKVDKQELRERYGK
ncbi:MAG: acyl-CoA synthetase [Chloroflexota bacterium]|jgi:fatty-acyl-CoA synthase